MNTISVITAVDPARAEHLPDTYASLTDQQLPDGWDWEWLVQVDSLDTHDREKVRKLLPEREPRLSLGANRASGPGVTRTMTLQRSAKQVVKTLDADDRLTPGALARDLAALAQPGVQWAASRVTNDRDGDHSPHYPYDPPAGRLSSGTVYRTYRDEDYRILVHPATLAIAFPLIAALGGWMALPASEDTALLMALDAASDGWFTNEVGMLYRKWGPQMSASAQHADPGELATRRAWCLMRHEAVAAWLTGG